jgi:phytanoyl-CoA hydroxylase
MQMTMSRPVTVDDYVRFREQGFLVARGVLDPAEVQELLDHTDELVTREPELLRIHMLHRRLAIHERFMLHPRIVDVVAGLVGPDVLALQTMLFVKAPGSPGQGYHQDSFHIITQPDTLIGAWVALDRADTENGCLWITPGSQH